MVIAPLNTTAREPIGFRQILEFGELFGKNWSVGAARLTI
jgi:hypothetical protein